MVTQYGDEPNAPGSPAGNLSCTAVIITGVKSSLLGILALLCVTVTAWSADITGKWWVDMSAARAAQGGRGGSMTGGDFEFKVSGDVLTGSVSSAGRGGAFVMVPIAEGKITSDSFSFTATKKNMSGNDEKLSYTGKVLGDKIELKVDCKPWE